MNFIVENEKLEIQYIPGNGAWTYHLIIPNTKNIKGKWGDLKVSGKIDDYEINNKNLAPLKNSDKKMSINSEIRNAINKRMAKRLLRKRKVIRHISRRNNPSPTLVKWGMTKSPIFECKELKNKWSESLSV